MGAHGGSNGGGRFGVLGNDSDDDVIIIEDGAGKSSPRQGGGMDPSKLNVLEVPELREALIARGLSTAGLKAELVEHLKTAIGRHDGFATAETHEDQQR